MRSFILRALLGVALFMSISAAGVCSIAEAQSQAGGLPALSDRVSALEVAASTLHNQVGILQSQVMTLQDSNTNLQNALNAEIANRQAGDSALQAALGTEITNRQNGDGSLQTAINQEASTRKTRDDALQAEIDSSSTKGFFSVKGLSDLVFGGSQTPVGTLALPAGSYFVTAVAPVENLKNSANWGCTLDLASDPTHFLAQTGVDTDTSTGHVGGSNNAVIIAMVTLAAADTIEMRCENSEGISGSQILETKIAAVTIGSATITDTP